MSIIADPAVLTFLALPLGILANYSWSKISPYIQNAKNKKLTENDFNQYKELFKNSLLTALKFQSNEWKNHFKSLIKILKKNPDKLIEIFSNVIDKDVTLLALLNDKDYQTKITKKISKLLEIEKEENQVLFSIFITDVLQTYFCAFLKQMNEKQGIGLILKEVIGQTFTLNNMNSRIINIEKNIDEKIINSVDPELFKSAFKKIKEQLDKLSEEHEGIENKIDKSKENIIEHIDEKFKGLILPDKKYLSSIVSGDVLTIGREKELKDIHEHLRDNNRLLIVNGIGGIGKTTIARK
jgi:energy-converting hydrogenase A subunit M